MPSHFIRHSRTPILEALGDTRVVYVMGARQVGKSTLTGEIATSEHLADVLSLDNRAARDAASSDPEGFVAGLSRPVLLDEIQRAGPDLLLAIKGAVDADQTPGQFLLTGSANVLTNRKVQDALTGRIEIITLWPLSQSEIEGSPAISSTPSSLRLRLKSAMPQSAAKPSPIESRPADTPRR
jgi:predicted AAA+ superfamily ATPase